MGTKHEVKKYISGMSDWKLDKTFKKVDQSVLHQTTQEEAEMGSEQAWLRPASRLHLHSQGSFLKK